MEYIDGVGPTTRGDGTTDLLSSSNLAEAVEQAAARLDAGDIKFQTELRLTKFLLLQQPRAFTRCNAASITVKEMEEMRSTALNIGRKLQSQARLEWCQNCFWLC